MNDTNANQGCNEEMEVDSDGGVFRLRDVLFYQHESGRVFSASSADLDDLMDPEAIDEEMTGLPHGVAVYEPDPDSLEGQAVDKWTSNVDAQIEREQAAPASGGVMSLTQARRNAATASTISTGGL